MCEEVVVEHMKSLVHVGGRVEGPERRGSIGSVDHAKEGKEKARAEELQYPEKWLGPHEGALGSTRSSG